jgi:excisionase family DNA binding protein
MALTESKADRALDSVGGKKLTHEQAAKLLGVNRSRVTQLVSAGELTELTPEAVEQHRIKRDRKKEDKKAFKERIRAIREAERQELLEAINRVDRHLMMLAAALGTKAIGDSIL